MQGTLLFFAAFYQRRALMDVMLRHGANPNATSHKVKAPQAMLRSSMICDPNLTSTLLNLSTVITLTLTRVISCYKDGGTA